MSEVTSKAPATKLALSKTKIGVLVAVAGLVIAGLVGFQFLNSPKAAPHAAAMPANPAIEERWGIRISQIGVTADGGLVDFRFVVLDQDKALAMMQDVNNLPILVAEDKSGIVNSAAMMPAKHDLNVGQTYFLLYRNTQNAVKANGLVSVLFSNDLRLEHAPVK